LKTEKKRIDENPSLSELSVLKKIREWEKIDGYRKGFTDEIISLTFLIGKIMTNLKQVSKRLLKDLAEENKITLIFLLIYFRKTILAFFGNS